jgi:hypothetical protein
MIDFDPNKPAKTRFNWATYFPWRNPAFKMHDQRGGALNAFQHHGDGILYHWNDDTGRWDEVCRLEKELIPPRCSVCHKETQEINSNWRQPQNWGKHVWVGKKTDSPSLAWCCTSYQCQVQAKEQNP